LAVWDYCERSTRFIFGASTGNAVADRILAALHQAGSEGLSRTELSARFERNLSKARLDEALGLLATAGLAFDRRPDTAEPGRPPTSWYATGHERNELSQNGGPVSSYHSFLSYSDPGYAPHVNGAPEADQVAMAITEQLDAVLV
jgi:hypothetical protein